MSSSCVVAAGCAFNLNCVEVEVEVEVELEVEDCLFSDPFSDPFFPSLDRSIRSDTKEEGRR